MNELLLKHLDEKHQKTASAVFKKELSYFERLAADAFSTAVVSVAMSSIHLECLHTSTWAYLCCKFNYIYMCVNVAFLNSRINRREELVFYREPAGS